MVYKKYDIKYLPFGAWKNKSKSGENIIHNSSGLIWLIRDPWNSVWSLYQLRKGSKSNKNLHQRRVTMTHFNPTNF